jgi:hypothetical protein
MSRVLPQEVTDRQLADMVRYLARLCLETERGLRPREQLERFMDPAAALRSRGLLTLGRFDGGPIQPADVGQAHVSRQPDGSVIASIVTRTEGRRWGAISFRLRARDGLWRIADVRRLLAMNQRTTRRERPIGPAVGALDRSRSR